MKKVYKLKDKYFNIEFVKKMSEIKEVNEYEEQEELKKQHIKEAKINEKFTFGLPPLQAVHIYDDYDIECMRIFVTVNDNQYQCKNYVMRAENEEQFFSLYKGIVTEERQKEYEQFKKEAMELLNAFKSLEK